MITNETFRWKSCFQNMEILTSIEGNLNWWNSSSLENFHPWFLEGMSASWFYAINAEFHDEATVSRMNVFIHKLCHAVYYYVLCYTRLVVFIREKLGMLVFESFHQWFLEGMTPSWFYAVNAEFHDEANCVMNECFYKHTLSCCVLLCVILYKKSSFY